MFLISSITLIKANLKTFFEKILTDRFGTAATMINQLIPRSIDFLHLQIFNVTLQDLKNVIKILH